MGVRYVPVVASLLIASDVVAGNVRRSLVGRGLLQPPRFSGDLSVVRPTS